MAARQTKTAASGNRRTSTEKKTSSSARRTTAGRGSSKKSPSTKSTAKQKSSSKSKTASGRRDIDYRQRSGMYDELEMIAALAISILLLLSIYDLCGMVGNYISRFIFGVLGWIAYLVPYMVFFGTAFYIANRQSRVAGVKIISGTGIFVSLASFLQMLSNPGNSGSRFMDFYEDSSVYRNGGGLVGGLVCRLLTPLFGKAGAYLIIVALFAICVVLFAGKAVFVSMFVKLREWLIVTRENYREHKALIDEARKQQRLEEEERVFAAGDDYEDDDYDDYDSDELDHISMMEDEEAPAKRRKKAAAKPKKAVEQEAALPEPAMIEPKQSYGEEIKPSKSIGFDLSMQTPSSVADNKTEIPEFTITHMDDVHRENAPADELDASLPEDFTFTPDPAYLEPEVMDEPAGDNHFQKIEIPDFMLNKPEKHDDSIGRTQQLPPLFDEDVEIKDIRQKTIEEKYTNLPEYEPGQADISPLEAVKRAAESSAEGMGNTVKKSSPSKVGSSKADPGSEPVTEAEIVPEVKEYVFPPIELLKKGKASGKSADTDKHLKETAQKLQSTFDSFGVKVHVTNVSCGPSVTRYELSPEQGVKVSRIVALSDDIKLNLAVADIRMEAPIPGKAAIGIEVPNKENTTVMLRDLLESADFKNNKSLIAFAAGRDIGGQVIIADIAKMPHLLIAGATGSGKSVCINTLIMSIIYKAKPEDVRLIMIDPKVVELSVYNGIPHLLIPVVTDPKKAAGALNWAVVEMEKRYAKFAELNVRDMKSYNAKIAACEYESEEHKKLPQIVIIVDELADLMMVASGEVEDAICRLAQLARAAGIHLVIATQRPSVNVITGLIKANVPSRIAFSVSSGVDSRTIIDMNGAEKLLGKGDMLFYPTGYQKPVRVQGAFVSDEEVNAVVEFLTKDQEKPQYNESIVNSISSGSAGGDKGPADDKDVYFAEAGRLIIEKDKASIGMLQRMYRIGFNRAARIMDQLCEAGVVGPEEGTKPRKVLMSPEQFEQYIDEYL